MSADSSSQQKPSSSSSENATLTHTLSAIIQEANIAFAQHQYEHAAMLFSQVAESFAQQFGTLHPKCADIHWRYGRALLYHAIENSGLLGDTEQLHNVTGKSEKDLVDMVTDPALSLPASKAGRKFHFQEDHEFSSSHDQAPDQITVPEEQATPVDQAHQAHENLPAESSVSQNPPGDSLKEEDEEEDDQEEEEDIEQDDFEIAFEVLDVARIIYSQMLKGDLPLDTTGIPNVSTQVPILLADKSTEPPTSDLVKVEQRYAQVMATLADVSLESESYDQAVQDFTLALEYLAKVFPKTDRRLAESHYKLALALEYNDTPNYELALTHLQQSLAVLESYHAQLSQFTCENNDLLMNRIDTEMNEIKELIPELELKIEDIKQTMADLKLKHPPPEATSSDANNVHLVPNSINDLSNAIKKKQPFPVGAAPSESPIKKPLKRDLEHSDDTGVDVDNSKKPKLE